MSQEKPRRPLVEVGKARRLTEGESLALDADQSIIWDQEEEKEAQIKSIEEKEPQTESKQQEAPQEQPFQKRLHVNGSVQMLKIPLNSLKLSPNNSRKQDIFRDLDELVLSIKKHGLLEPIVINQNNEIVCGQRRAKACELVGLTQITCRQKAFSSPEEELIYSATENLQRSSLDISDRISLVKRLLPKYKTLEAVAEALGLNRTTVSNWMVGTSLGTPEEIEAATVGQQDVIKSRYIVEAIKAANLPTVEERKKAIEALKKLSREEVEAIAKKTKETGVLNLAKPSLPESKQLVINVPLGLYKKLEQAARMGNKSIEETALDAFKAYVGAVGI
jgi:ParB/RepB/Spo0J family partition protein